MGERLAKRAAAGAAIAATLFAGCGGGEGAGAGGATRTLNIHVTSSLRGYGDAIRAEQLAVEDAGGRAGRFRIRVIVHDEPVGEADSVRRNARAAARDPDAIAYVGDINSGSTAISAPILNRAGLLQVSPTSTYVGLTRSEGGAPGEPEKYRPTGRRTFARVIPADHVQARAGVIYAREMGVKRLGVVADGTLYGQGLAKLVLSAARDLGVEAIDGGRRGDPATQAQRVRAKGADGVYFGVCSAPGEMIDLAEAQGAARTFTGDCYAGLNSDLPRPVTQLDGRLFVTVPGGGLERTPVGRHWADRWRDRIGSPMDEKLMFAYEAMRAVLAAIERAGADGDDRAAVVREFFATRDRESILGRYGIDREGDTTLRSYGGFAMRGGRLRFDRVLDTGG